MKDAFDNGVRFTPAVELPPVARIKEKVKEKVKDRLKKRKWRGGK